LLISGLEAVVIELECKCLSFILHNGNQTQMVKLPYLTAVRFSGDDAGDFLHNQLSADVLALAPDESTFACYCEPKGRVLALMLVARKLDDYYVVMSGSLVAAIANRLKIYVMRANVKVDVLDEMLVAGCHGRDEVSSGTRLGLPDSDDALLITDDDSAVSMDPGDSDVWKLAELERGVVWLDSDTSAQFLPQMLGYSSIGAVNFRKGCYPGQEIVARIHYLGKNKRHPRLLCSAEPISVNPMVKIQCHAAGESYPAVVVDHGKRQDGGSCVFVVSRMDPELPAEKIEVEGQLVSLVQV